MAPPMSSWFLSSLPAAASASGAPPTAATTYWRVQTTWSAHSRRKAALRDQIASLMIVSLPFGGVLAPRSPLGQRRRVLRVPQRVLPASGLTSLPLGLYGLSQVATCDRCSHRGASIASQTSC